MIILYDIDENKKALLHVVDKRAFFYGKGIAF